MDREGRGASSEGEECRKSVPQLQTRREGPGSDERGSCPVGDRLGSWQGKDETGDRHGKGGMVGERERSGETQAVTEKEK